MDEVLCSYCGNKFLLGKFNFCTHCARPSLYPNVHAATTSTEIDALNARYDDALRAAQASGTDKEVGDFGSAIENAYVVCAKYFGEIVRISLNDNELYGTYFQLVQAGVKVPGTDKWNRIRAYAEEALFPGYKENITFAALSITGRGLSHYGDCFLIFRENMIAHRSSLLEENCVFWITHRNVQLMDDDLPKGYRSNWENRVKLVIAKLASEITQGMVPANFANLLLRPRNSTLGTDEDEFVEVHLWGPWTRRSLSHVVIAANKTGLEPEVKQLSYCLNSVGVTLEVLPSTP